MKKLLAVLTISALAVTAFGQGQVVFINNTAGMVRQWTGPADPTVISAPVGGASVELFTAPAGTALNAMGTYTGNQFFPSFPNLAAFIAANPGWSALATTGITPVAGRFNGGTQNLPGVAGGVNAEYVVLGWTIGGGNTTWDQALAGGMVGTSLMFTTTTGNPTTTPPGTAIPLSGTLTGTIGAPNTGVFMTPVPEPTSFALAGLGLAALLVFRRRN